MPDHVVSPNEPNTLWLAVAPVGGGAFWDPEGALAAAFDFGGGVTLQKAPGWMAALRGSDRDPDHRLNSFDMDRFAFASHCFIAAYESPGPLDHDPTSKPEDPRNKAVSAQYAIGMAHLALWLVKPLQVTYRFIVFGHLRTDGAFVVDYFHTEDLYLVSSDFHQENFLTPMDLEKAKEAFGRIIQLQRETWSRGALGNALGAIRYSFPVHFVELKYSYYWVALEALFGPVTQSTELTYQLSLRIALFLETRRERAEDLQKEVKKWYGLRSQVIHGLRLGLPGAGAARTAAQKKIWDLYRETEDRLRITVVRILLDEKLSRAFSEESSREALLKGLPFAGKATSWSKGQ